MGCLPITGRSAQDLGSSLTYLRRYLLGCMTGIVTDEDEDGALANDAGAQRPQADTPPPVQAAHVQNLQSRLGTLNPDQTAEVRAWWSDQGLPFLADLTQAQADTVHQHLDAMAQEGRQDPQ